MNQWTSRQRKLAYLGGILVLLMPIVILGMPGTGKVGSGGIVAQQRQKYDLGETDLGDVDPSSAAMNLVLLGLRGVAVNSLWMDLEYYKDRKDWAQMLATTQSIIRLQPHFEKVWDYNGHNLAYNTSAEWDAVPDRWYWVKEGAKFLQKGVARNQGSTELHYRVGNIFQKKIGIADEQKYYRQYFRNDPDPQFQGPDPEINPNGEDSYLVARQWFLRANEKELVRPQHILDKSLFRSHPARCLFDYAQALQKEGQFGETTRQAWADALREWKETYGQEEFIVPVNMEGTQLVTLRLEMTEDEIKQVTRSEDEFALLRRMVMQYQNMTNYRYWRTRGFCEAEPETAQAHKDFYEAGEEYQKQNLRQSQALAESCLKGFDDILKRTEYVELQEEDLLVEECLMALMLYENIHRLNGEPMPEEYPLKWLAEKKSGLRPEVEKRFERRFLSQ